jgi:hypothetical protein
MPGCSRSMTTVADGLSGLDRSQVSAWVSQVALMASATRSGSGPPSSVARRPASCPAKVRTSHPAPWMQPLSTSAPWLHRLAASGPAQRRRSNRDIGVTHQRLAFDGCSIPHG